MNIDTLTVAWTVIGVLVILAVIGLQAADNCRFRKMIGKPCKK